MTNDKLTELLNDMSLDEKIGQLIQIPGYFMESGSYLTGPAVEMGYDKDIIYNCGSTLSVFTFDKIKPIQDEFMANQPHHIPLLFMADIINGYRSVFPIPLGQGCSFDPELSGKLAKMAAKESAAEGLQVTFSPMADLVRDARWGRVMESTGEDPYLNSRFAESIVKGYQGDDVSSCESVASCVKHFAAYSAPEGGRDYNTVELSERTMRDDYLPGYKAAVDAGAEMVMTSFNTIDRIPATANKHYMREILREEWGFDGVLISDWGAISELISHGIAENEEEAARLAIEAGVDIDMCTPVYIGFLKKLVEDGTVPEKLINESCLRVLELKNKLGLFEDPYHGAENIDRDSIILCDEHRKLCRKAAEEAAVLLKNENNLLPLDIKGLKVAFIGPYADNKQICGAWSLLADSRDAVSVKEGVESLRLENKFRFSKGSGILENGRTIYGFMGDAITDDSDNEALLKEAIKDAKWADRVVLMLGEHREQSGEGGSRGDIRLPKPQRNLIKEIAKVNKNIVSVIFTGRPLDIRDVLKLSQSVMIEYFPGIEGGNALARLLFGVTSPSGHLSMSFPYSVGQVPVHYDSFSTGRPYEGDKTNRFKSKYSDIPVNALYPFGHGLTYSSFEYSPVELSSNELLPGGKITAGVVLRNSGDIEATEVVQLYIRDVKGSVVRPVKQLKGFKRVTLKPKECTRVDFDITEDMLRFTGLDMSFSAEPGEYIAFISGTSAADNGASFVLRY